jgi:hypothetical protein
MNIKQNTVYFLLSLLLTSLLIYYTEPVLPGHIFWQSKNLHKFYIAAAQNPFDYNVAPFCWRITVPTLVYLSPLSPTNSFLFITVVSIMLSGMVLGRIIEFYSRGLNSVLGGIILFYSTVFAVRYNLIEFWNPDAMLILFMLLGVLFSIQRKPVEFVVVSIVGVLIKETYLIILPLYFTLNYFNNKSFNIEKRGNKSSFFKESQYLIRETIIVSVLPIVAFFGIRYLIKGEGEYNFFNLFMDTLKLRFGYFVGVKLSLNRVLFEGQNSFMNSAINIYRISVGAFGGILILGIIHFKKSTKIYLSYLPLIIGVYLQLLVAVDNERLVVLAFLPMIISSLDYLMGKYESKKISFSEIALYIVGYFSVQILLVKDVYHELYYSVLAQIILTMIFIAYLFMKNRSFKVSVK